MIEKLCKKQIDYAVQIREKNNYEILQKEFQDKIVGIKKELEAEFVKSQIRSFNAASQGRLTSDWAIAPIQINQDLRFSLRLLKTRCREAAKNNPHFKKYLNMRKVNIVGENGIRLIMNVKDQNGDPDIDANKKIEAAFEDFSRPANFTTSGTMSRKDVEELLTACLAYDGEFFIRMIPNFNNPHKFSLQIIDSILVDYQFSTTTQLSNGNWLVNGIEVDQWERPQAYYIRKTRPDSYDYGTSFEYDIIPASEIIHVFYKEHPGQLRGIPMAAAGLPTLLNIQGYAEAELVAARMQACKSTYFTGDDMSSWDNNQGKDSESGKLELSESMQPGVQKILPKGWDVKNVDPTHPNGNYANYVKANLREAANALGVAYNEFSNDLENVSYSSIRQGVLFERDCWKQEQDFISTHFDSIIFNKWLEISLLIGNLGNLPFSKLWKFKNADTWQGRRWSWVDPKSDIMASQMAIANGIKSRQQICNENGTEFEEVIEDLKQEKEAAGDLIVDLAAAKNTQTEKEPPGENIV